MLGWMENKIPPFYEQVFGVNRSEYQKNLGSQTFYDFNEGADYVIINLGTNDNF